MQFSSSGGHIVVPKAAACEEDWKSGESAVGGAVVNPYGVGTFLVIFVLKLTSELNGCCSDNITQINII